MKKGNSKVLFVTFLLSLILTSALVSADVGTPAIDSGQVKSSADQKLADMINKSPLLAGISYFVFGIHDLQNSNDKFSQQYGLTSIFIMFFLIWLILFVTFSDIISAFGAFSNRAIGWIVGFAVTVIAANIKIVQIIAVWAIWITSIFGALSVFVGLIFAFVAFLAISIGAGRFTEWALNRQANIHAAHGRSEMREGVTALREAGRGVQQNQNPNRWLFPAIVILIIIIIIGIIIYQTTSAP